MANRTLNLTDDLIAYVRRLGVREHPALAHCERTAPMPMAQMQIGSDQGAFMALLVRLIGAKRILEIGTFTGYSSTAMALALPPDGRITCLDVSEEWTDRPRGLGRCRRRRQGRAPLAPAAETLATLDDDSFDLAFIDADKPGYDTYYEECSRRAARRADPDRQRPVERRGRRARGGRRERARSSARSTRRSPPTSGSTTSLPLADVTMVDRRARPLDARGLMVGKWTIGRTDPIGRGRPT